jgi:type II secretory pathway component PulJ
MKLLKIRLSGKRAFTLPEVFISLLVFAMTIAVFSETMRNTFMAYERMETKGQSQDYKTILRKTVLSTIDMMVVEEGGVIQTAEREVYWKSIIQPSEVLDTFYIQVLYEVKGSSSTEHKELGLYVYRPDWSEVEEREKLVEQRQREWELKFKKI